MSDSTPAAVDGLTQKQQKHQASDTPKASRQVISRLFSYNPVRQSEVTAAEEQEWIAPEPTNAPLAHVANFGSLTISARLVDELAKMGLARPTAIQQKVIPHMLSSSSDAFVQAETGSGKTFSYLLPLIHRVLLLSGPTHDKQKKVHRDSGVFAIIVSPTRELAKQVHVVLEQLIRPFPWLVSTAITGGESKKAEKARIRKGINFLVATPGRLADHIENTKALKLSTVRWLILDEGDRLMELGFEQDVQKTISALRTATISSTTLDGLSLQSLPERCVTILCSATMKMNVQKLGEMSLSEASLLVAEQSQKGKAEDQKPPKAPAQLHQSYMVVPAKLRLVMLISHLRAVFSRRDRTMKVIVFFSCADSVDFHYELVRYPTDANWSMETSRDSELTSKTVSNAAYLGSAASSEVIVHRMHGSLSQPTRTATLRSFSGCKLPSVLLTTDVSSRGLDIPSVDLVIEYDPAFSFADHIHRVGRTARAGRQGGAVLYLLPGSEEGYIGLLKSSATPTVKSYNTVLQKGLLSKLEFPVETSAKPIEGVSYHDRAEALQLHIEQRLLNEAQKLELARNGFKSHIRAYATHIKDERVYFDMTQLHLGHVAKSFGLREAPGGIGAGIERKTRRRVKQPPASRSEVERPSSEHLVKKKGMLLMKATADEFNIG
ncbi:hypothetical protein CDD81_2723 [Ophiocordyceps australis]|uniref:ATP-dependent RNA helicase n=1 Tax=Ophiocordyceps australis TaxID=1399860 RepID=A0A2C5YEL2_9HYPO|nr:hypothetical protein CDD81_2723 [Ophiocordyceps australis]